MNKYLTPELMHELDQKAKETEARWNETYNGRFDRLMSVKGMLENWWPKTDAEKKCIEAIIAKIGKYLDYLDEE